MSDPGLPDWARPLETTQRLSRFEDEVLGFFASRGMEVTMADGVVTPAGGAAAGAEGGVKKQQWGLGNLMQVCARAAEPRWRELVHDHFTRLLMAQRVAQESEIESIDYRAVADNLAVRLWESSVLENATGAGGAAAIGKMVTREDLPGLLTVLSMDLPQSVRTVPGAEADLWGRSREELFDRAIENLEKQTDAKIEAHEIGDGGTVVSVLGESHFIASLALKIEQYPELIGKHGSFVGLPTRHVMLVAPFGGLDALKSLQHLMTITQRWFADGPGSLSGRVWWYRRADEEREAQWFEVVFEITDDALNVSPPEELVRVMEELAGGGDGAGA
jgi:hypothetical protein